MVKSIREKKQKKAASKNSNIWKIISITFIVLFLIVIGAGLIRIYHFNSLSYKATTDEMNLAKNVVFTYLSSTSTNISIDNIKVSDRIRNIEIRDSNNESINKVIEAYTLNGNKKNVFLIDIKSNIIVMHSQTEFFGWMNNSKYPYMGSRKYGTEKRR